MERADMSEMKIERAVATDAEALSRLGTKTFSDKFAHLYKPEDLQLFLDTSHSVAAYDRALADPEIAIWKAVSADGELAGYAVAGPCGLPVEDMPEGALEISRLYVDEAFQSMGLGRTLMDAMLSWIDRDGRAPLYLSVYKFNEGAQRFYHRYGFELLKEYRYRVGNHFDPEYLYVRTA